MSLKDKIDAIKVEFEGFIDKHKHDADKLSEIYTDFFGRKSGKFTLLMKDLPNIAKEERKEIGKLINITKNKAESQLKSFQEILLKAEQNEKLSKFDLTLGEKEQFNGSIHPITQVSEEIKSIFRQMGFQVELGPEVETEYNNFDALNIPGHHPARDMQDTFYIEKDIVLRTHTSPVQIRTMLANENPPIKMLAPGKVYRNEEISSRSYAYFHQIEGLFVDKDVKFSDLKGVLEFFIKSLYGSDAKARYRPSYFPFTEPSVEVDVSCVICGGKGCSVCKKTGWLEILGAGMVHPNVLKSGKIDPEKYTGFAFGLGVERIAMLKYGITDIRHFHNNDVRFLEQF